MFNNISALLTGSYAKIVTIITIETAKYLAQNRYQYIF